MYLSFIWHFHQPIYRHPETGKFLLPWVNYHTTKNYWQMLKLVETYEFPCAINLVPCLLEQMEDYAQNRAEDPFFDSLLKTPEKLRAEDLSRWRRFFPSLAEEKSTAVAQKKVLNSFFSPLLEPEKKTRDELLHLRQKIFQEILGYFSALKNKNLLEITLTPYYHPLLPLLIDLGLARNEAPELPDFSYPEDADWHLREARLYFERLFGFCPQGVWPSEGAVSAATCQRIKNAGFNLAFTDEHLLWQSLDHRPDPLLLYQPYECSGLKILFRDRELSDLIGFEYHRWPADQAVADFFRRLEVKASKSSEEAILTIILDGENPWGAYQNNGLDFLRKLFEQLKSQQRFLPITPSQYLMSHHAYNRLNLVAGTWMSSFFKWVGHPEKVRTWKRLAEVRQRRAFSRYLAVAEGSDWFWWAGETQEPEFDQLFSAYLNLADREGER
jgi:alpha-amylase/alpha-mannosidase (GH57 family)